MKSQLIEDFLNLPGIDGIALIDGHSRAYVHGLPMGAEAAQQQLTEGIQQILETTPSTLESFAFYFERQHVFLHKVDRGMALLVMAQPLVSDAYGKLIAQITRFMRTDFDAVVAALVEVVRPVLVLEVGQPIVQAATPAPVEMPGVSPATSPALADPRAAPVSQHDAMPLPSLGEVATALEQLSQFTTQYLGKFIVANHWRNYRPDDRWITQFQVTTTGTISLANPSSLDTTLTQSQLVLVQTWVDGFSQRCAKIIRDYPKLVRAQALDTRQWQLLFGMD
ncbi:MAG: hypothetical protein AAFQ61_11770 [Cyanobacteria bacterium J06626_23]